MGFNVRFHKDRGTKPRRNEGGKRHKGELEMS